MRPNVPAPGPTPSPRTGWRGLLRHFGIDLRSGEGPVASMLFLYFFLIVAFQYTSKSVRQSSFVDELGAAKLPIVYLLLAFGTLPVLWAYGRLIDRMGRKHLIPVTTLAVSGSVVLFWWLYGFEGAWIRVAFYVWVSIAYVLQISQFWSYSNHVLDARQAKRLFGFIGAGGLLGGVCGGQIARLATSLVDTRFALLVAAGILVVATGTIYAVQRAHGARALDSAEAAGLKRLEQARGGFSVIRHSRHLSLIAAVMLVTVTVANVVDVQFNWAMEQATAHLSASARLDALTGGYGNFYTIMGIAALLFQLAFTARIHRRLGIGFAMKVLPVTLGLGSAGLLAAAAAAAPAAMLTFCRVLKIGENGLRYSLDQATRELLFLPVPSRARLEAKAYIDVFVQRSGKVFAGLLLLPVTLGWFGVIQAGWISLALVAVWLALTVATRREYVRSFRNGLRGRTVETDVPLDLSDITTLEILVESLGSVDKRQVLHALELLRKQGRGNLVPPLLLYHDDSEVRLETLHVLTETGRRDALPLIERCVGDSDPAVRAEAIHALASLKQRDVVEMMLPRLDDCDPEVRAAAIAAVANHDDGPASADAARALTDMISDADPQRRAEAAKAVGAVREPLFQEQLLGLLYDPDPLVVREAIGAVGRRAARDGARPLYTPVLVSLLRSRRVKHDSREALVALGEPVIPVLVHFMRDTGESLWVRRALPKTLAGIGTPPAIAALAEQLGQIDDAFLRRKLIEALSRVAGRIDPAHAPRIHAAIRGEAEGYLRCLMDLWDLGAAGRAELHGPRVRWREEHAAPSILEHLLADRMEEHLDNVFRLLETLHPPANVRAAARGLLADRGHLRSHALEYLENTLSGSVRRHVFAVVGDAPLEEKLRQATRLFGITQRSLVEVLRAALHEPRSVGEETGTWRAAALYSVYAERVTQLYPDVRALTGAEERFVRETAHWAADRLRLTAAGS